jgi:hypothetical protein
MLPKEPQLAATDCTRRDEIPEPTDEMSFRLGAVYKLMDGQARCVLMPGQKGSYPHYFPVDRKGL